MSTQNGKNSCPSNELFAEVERLNAEVKRLNAEVNNLNAEINLREAQNSRLIAVMGKVGGFGTTAAELIGSLLNDNVALKQENDRLKGIKSVITSVTGFFKKIPSFLTSQNPPEASTSN